MRIFLCEQGRPLGYRDNRDYRDGKNVGSCVVPVVPANAEGHYKLSIAP